MNRILGYGQSTEKDDTLTSLFTDITEFQKPDFMFAGDSQVMRLAIYHVTWAYSYADEQLRDDKKLMLSAVRKDGYALEYGSARLRDDDDVVNAALKENKYSLCYASERLGGQFFTQ